jgi:hypothetical protein
LLVPVGRRVVIEKATLTGELKLIGPSQSGRIDSACFLRAVPVVRHLRFRRGGSVPDWKNTTAAELKIMLRARRAERKDDFRVRRECGRRGIFAPKFNEVPR